MLRLLSLVVLVPALLGTPALHAEDASVTLSHHQIHRLIASAHTEQDYERLASYYRHQAQINENLSLEQQRLWQDELQHPRVGAGKFPNAADNARRLHEYYADQARLDREKMHLYEQTPEIRTSPPNAERSNPLPN